MIILANYYSTNKMNQTKCFDNARRAIIKREESSINIATVTGACSKGGNRCPSGQLLVEPSTNGKTSSVTLTIRKRTLWCNKPIMNERMNEWLHNEMRCLLHTIFRIRRKYLELLFKSRPVGGL